MIFDRSYREVARFPAGNGRESDLHEFVLTPRGTALVTSWETAGPSTRSAAGAAR